MRQFNKIFGIGLYKTGTTSLQQALNILGFRCFHAVTSYEEAVKNSGGGLFPKSILDAYDAFCDNPFPAHFKEFDKRYPNSKFILTVRDLKSWLRSVKRHVDRNRFDPFYRRGFNRFDEFEQTKLWHSHHEEVKKYFAARPRDILVMDIIQGEGWRTLCQFLNEPVPSVPFPHANRSISVPFHLMQVTYHWVKNRIVNRK